MKLTNIDELTRLNELFDQCQGEVYIGTPDGRTFLDMRDRTARLQGLVALTGEKADLYGIYAYRREDEALLMRYMVQQMRKTA